MENKASIQLCIENRLHLFLPQIRNPTNDKYLLFKKRKDEIKEKEARTGPFQKSKTK